GGEGYNELRFDDAKGKEQIFIHAQKDLEIRAENTIKINTMGNCLHLTTGCVPDGKPPQGDCYIQVNKDAHERIKGESRSMTDGTATRIVAGKGIDWYQSNHRTTVGLEELVEAPVIIHQADNAISLNGPGGFIKIDHNGVTIVGKTVRINSGGDALTSQAAGVDESGKAVPIDQQAKPPVEPKPADQSRCGAPSAPPAVQAPA